MWLEIELDTNGAQLRVSGRGSRGERPPAHTLPPERGTEALQTFANKVGRAVRGGKALDGAVVEEARAFYAAIFADELRDVLVRLGEASKEGPLLVRLFAADRALASIPWEALCRPGTSEGFVGTDPRVLFARGVTSSEPWEPREVQGAVRVLAIAPGSDARAVEVLREALAPSIETGEIEWLEPILGPDIGARVLFDKLRRGKSPHVVHFLGHGGVDLAGKPSLRLADDEDGEEVWITAEAFGRELSASFCEELRLVVLEACEGAKAGAFGSAAEILARAGADAVVAHLWPVKTDVARTCSTEIYRALTARERREGDVGASVAAARRTLLAGSAEAFSPVLYLRGASSVIFNFEGRRVAQPAAKRGSKRVAPALLSLLDRAFTTVLGDQQESDGGLRQDLEQYMRDEGDTAIEGLSLSALTQRCVLQFGQDVLQSIFQQALTSSLGTPIPPLVASLGRLVPPGVHVTLLWHPYLERAIADQQKDRTVYAIQPALAQAGGKPRVVKRAAGAPTWKMEPSLPKRFELDREIVVIRVYGGYSAEARPILSTPIVTEDDHLHGMLGAAPPLWMEELLARPRIQPGLFVGLSVLDWRHRQLLYWLYDKHPAPENSLALMSPAADPREAGIWDAGGGLPGTGRIGAITEDPEQLAPLLDEIERAGAS
jgi:CHAT domain